MNNNRVESKILTNQGENKYPTIGAFGIYSDNTFEAMYAH